ncbi:hypothetical protein AQUCO_02000305v1 [Aquilegia coerulea]|uniref:Uncharacterized protein n=1 Tax=Aquilegia coerulea TaxID=218851 RepID=A0A2G5DHR1_AQUCA|nr:hypothetical protein AQUCO_02000305v1 [Aquilegia coerulea]
MCQLAPEIISNTMPLEFVVKASEISLYTFIQVIMFCHLSTYHIQVLYLSKSITRFKELIPDILVMIRELSNNIRTAIPKCKLIHRLHY